MVCELFWVDVNIEGVLWAEASFPKKEDRKLAFVLKGAENSPNIREKARIEWDILG